MVLRVGELDGPAERTFGRIGDVVVGPAEEILVADLMVPTIRVFDAEGGYLRSFGRAGQGPGELVSIFGLHAADDGLVPVWDPLAGRITLLDLYGQGVRATLLVDSRLGTGDPDALKVTRSGRSLVLAPSGGVAERQPGQRPEGAHGLRRSPGLPHRNGLQETGDLGVQSVIRYRIRSVP